MSVSDAWFHRVKSAQRDLIRLCGGIERSAEITSVSKSHIGRMNNPTDPELMPISAVIALEADCGQAVVTGVMAGVNGRRLTDPEAEKAAGASIMAAFAEVKRQDAELTHEVSLAISDGNFTAAEATHADGKAARLQDAVNDLRASLARAKATGGAKAGLRVVGEE